MFSYYGAKTKIARLYPRPAYPLIVEPFAGSARYALEHFECDVLLFDVSRYVVDTWRYLIGASRADILSLPLVPSHEDIDRHTQLTDAEKYLIGWHLCRGKSVPRRVGHGWNSWEHARRRIADDLYKIRHWRVELRSFTRAPRVKATWFIDPPYPTTQAGTTERYLHWEVDPVKLYKFRRSREGQVISCGIEGDDWAPFRLLVVTQSMSNKPVREMIYVEER